MQNQKNSFKDARILTIEIIDILPTNGMSTECHGTNLKPALSKTKNTIVHNEKLIPFEVELGPTNSAVKIQDP